MKETKTLEISNISKEIDIEGLQKFKEQFGFIEYNQYLDWVIIQGLKAHVAKECNFEQEKIDNIKFSFNTETLTDFIIIKDDKENPLKCILSINFSFEDNTISLVN